MQKSRLVRCCIVLLIGILLLNGCADRTLTDKTSQSASSGKVVLTDPWASESSIPYQPEAPSVDDLLTPGKNSDDSPSSRVEQPSSAQESSVAPEPAPISEPSAPPESSVAPEPSNVATSSSEGEEPSLPLLDKSGVRMQAVKGEVRAVWISYLELNGLLTNQSKEQFTKNIRGVFDNCAAYGLNTVIVHVRPFADAIYKSQYYPWSYLCTGVEGVDPGFDPLAIMVEEAHARNLRIEAWLNPYRIRNANSKYAICDTNPAVKWLSAGDSAVIVHNGVTSYNPASKKAQDLIVNGVREIVRNYNVDGIHIDDYFYPTTATGAVDMSFDASSYRAYVNGGGQLSQADWRRRNVETLLKAMYSAIKEEDPDVLFGISPQSSVYNNYNALFLDVAKIASTPGYCDYICPQIYFGYQNQAQPYQETLESWNNMVTCKDVDLYVGLAAYKVGAPDQWAGTGKNEWLNHTDLLARMVKTARNQSSYKGFVLYRYDSLFAPEQGVATHVGKEYENLKTLL
jgi:uncharacterized lipoprotein YddW (UPF0748 family)